MTWNDATAGKDRISYLVLVEIELATETVYIHDGVGSFDWDGHTWSGVGDFGAISAITSGADLTATGIALTLSGVPSTYRSDLLNATSRGSDITIYHGFWDEAAGTWDYEPETALVGIVNTARLVDGGEDEENPTVSITVNVITAASYSRRLTLFRRSNAHQQSLFAGDLFLEYTTDLRTGLTLPATGTNVVSVNPGGGIRPNPRHAN